MNANADKGASSEASLVAASPSKLVPSTEGMSSGDGKYATTPLIISWTPLFLYEEPQIQG